MDNNITESDAFHSFLNFFLRNLPQTPVFCFEAHFLIIQDHSKVFVDYCKKNEVHRSQEKRLTKYSIKIYIETNKYTRDESLQYNRITFLRQGKTTYHLKTLKIKYGQKNKTLQNYLKDMHCRSDRRDGLQSKILSPLPIAKSCIRFRSLPLFSI